VPTPSSANGTRSPRENPAPPAPPPPPTLPRVEPLGPDVLVGGVAGGAS
jgi:hypothetical protein